MRFHCFHVSCFTLVVGLAAAVPLPAADFLPVSESELAPVTAADAAAASAVVLFNKAELKIMDYPAEVSSYMKVWQRIKILSEEGMAFAEVVVPHSRFLRLESFAGRTILPDGTEVPLTDDSVFVERSSAAEKIFATKAAFPAVEVGAIVDYTYTLRWDSILALEPWLFHERLPILLSEITYIKPNHIAVKPWGREMDSNKIHLESSRSRGATAIRVWMENLPAVPDEPYSFPFADLSSRFMMVPSEMSVGGVPVALLDTWRDACNIFEELYDDVRRKDGKVRRQAKQLTAGASERRDRIATLHAFVRDEIQNEPSADVFVHEGSRVDRVLEERSGNAAEKALLLEVMLDAIKVDSELVWANDREMGQLDLSVANPWWFERVLVRVEHDGRPVYLDPVDRSLGFGRLAPGYEGGQALVFDARDPQTIELPLTPHQENLRRAEVALVLDDEGRVSGRGSLELGGHRAWSYLRWRDDAEATRDAWREELEELYPGYEVSAVEVEEALDDARVRVAWALTQRDEEVLGDEATLHPSRPMGPVEQPFELPPDRRLTPVQLAFASRSESRVELTWPAGWELDVVPEKASHDGAAGELSTAIEIDADARRLTYARRLDITARQFAAGDGYRAIRELFGAAEKSDAQPLVLVRR